MSLWLLMGHQCGLSPSACRGRHFPHNYFHLTKAAHLNWWSWSGKFRFSVCGWVGGRGDGWGGAVAHLNAPFKTEFQTHTNTHACLWGQPWVGCQMTAVCADLPSGTHTYRLEELAYARSGDKGDSANIGETCMDQVLPLSFSSEEQKQMQIIGFLRNLQILGKK